MKDLRKLMTVGTFGITKNGNEFVVISDTVVAYQSGGWDYIESLLVEPDYDDVEFLVTKCNCFKSIDYWIEEGKYISYDARKDVCMTLGEVEEKLGIKNLKIVLEK